MRRLALAALVLLAGAEPAAADPPPPTLCAAVSATAPRCHRSVTYEAGRTVFLRGRTRPGPVDVLRRRPHQARFTRVATVTVGADGRVRWSWPTRDRHIDGGTPWVFALRRPAGERSNLVEVWVVAPHDP